MLAFCETALVYTRGLTQAAFTADRMCYDATLRNVELLGEIASDLPRVQDSLRALLQRLPPGQA